MSWFGSPPSKDPATPSAGPQALVQDIQTRGAQYLEDVDQGKLVYPACKRAPSDAQGDEATVLDHTRLEAFRVSEST